VAKTLRAEIKQRKPFPSLEQEVFVNLLRTADRLMQGVEKTLGRVDLSQTQYNVLRILRGAGPDGMACRELSKRMITRDPDITRLLDRMEARSLVTRTRDTVDRRVVRAKISATGLKIVDGLDRPVQRTNRRQLGQLTRRQLEELNRLLDRARTGKY
jgi:DNA-binding MarR family transcriptional regulator